MRVVNEFNDYVGYKIELNPTEEQKEIFEQYFKVAKLIYNLGIDIQEDSISKNGYYLNFKNICKELVNLKNTDEYKWLYQYDSAFLKLILADVVNAYNLYTQNSKHFKKPVYKSKSDKSRFPIRSDSLRIEDGRIRISTIGYVDCINSYSDEIIGISNPYLKGNYLKFTDPRISKEGSRYYLSFSILKDETHNISSYDKYYGNPEWREKPFSEPVGIDFGLRPEKWLKDSTRKVVERPLCKKEKAHISKLQSKINNQYNINKDRDPKTFRDRQPLKNGISKNMQKNINKLNEEYDRITNLRHEAVHQYCNYLLDLKPRAVVMEDLKALSFVIKDDDNTCSIKRRKENALLYDAAIYDTKKIIEDTMVNNGIPVVYAGRRYPSSQICSNCGYINKISPTAKYYRCELCGYVEDRDFNAAYNLANIADYAYLKSPVKKLRCPVKRIKGE